MERSKKSQLLYTLFKRRKRRTLYLIGFLVTVFITIQTLSKDILVEIPVEGGSFSEAIVGYPRFINPVLAQSQTDRDISEMLFSGLLKQDQNGTYVNELAQSYSTNEDYTIHTIVLHPNRSFHDGSTVVTEDVLFTYALIQDPLIKSPLFARLNNVRVESPETNTITFTLETGNENFIDNLTIGILSQAHWENVSLEEFPFADQNISPLGTGPYAIRSITRDKEQKISSFILEAFRKNEQKPFIETIELKFFANQILALQAFESGLVDNLSNISAQELLRLDHTLEQKNIQTSSLSRIFSLFFNRDSNPVFNDEVVRSVINNTIDSDEIVREVFFSRADSIDGPLPENNQYYFSAEAVANPNASSSMKQLEDAGWRLDDDNRWAKESMVLAFDLHVPEAAELIKSAEIIQKQLAQINIVVTIIPVDESRIINAVVRTRDFESLLFGQIVYNTQQLYAFWHSSGVTDPGVNIAGYTNKTVDAILERLIENSSNLDTRRQDFTNLQKEIRSDMPVVFLYSPHFIYATDVNIKNNKITNLEFASDRFNNINQWYTDTEKLLPYFNRN